MVTRNRRLMVGVGVEQRDEEETMGTSGAQHEQRELNGRVNGCESVSRKRQRRAGWCVKEMEMVQQLVTNNVVDDNDLVSFTT
ncbi:hypothetical protein V6N12_035060 [Hibiscus sabdariffa]|uniref:Uncharacterized protein n=1 Tax=Hibiscus sabdariffa TaxID=183260 RepID=A0ABR1ZVR5_9ROSI